MLTTEISVFGWQEIQNEPTPKTRLDLRKIRKQPGGATLSQETRKPLISPKNAVDFSQLIADVSKKAEDDAKIE